MSDQKQEVKLQTRDLQPARGSLLLNGHSQAAKTDIALPQNGDVASNGMTMIGFIDKYSFTRECIAQSLQTTGTDLCVVPHVSCEEILKSNRDFDLFLFHLHCEDEEFERSELISTELDSIISLKPVIVLSEIERSDFISFSFRRGARGYIPIRSTPAGLAIEIIRLVKAGGTFVPLSGLPLHDTRTAGESCGVNASRELTPREQEVLKFLKRGKTNKSIAYQLQLSESTVKAHIRHIMKKMNVRNRTEVVYHAYGNGNCSGPTGESIARKAHVALRES